LNGIPKRIDVDRRVQMQQRFFQCRIDNRLQSGIHFGSSPHSPLPVAAQRSIMYRTTKQIDWIGILERKSERRKNTT
jgi:hypothetical protein